MWKFVRRRRGTRESLAPPGGGPLFTDPSVQRAQLQALRKGGPLSFFDPWGRGPVSMWFAFASGLLFVGLCVAFCGIYYAVFEVGKSKAHRALLHLVAGSVTAALLVSLLIVFAAVAVRKVREAQDTRRQILEAQRRSGGATSWRSTPPRPN